jgi:hypothetical protein
VVATDSPAALEGVVEGLGALDKDKAQHVAVKGHRGLHGAAHLADVVDAAQGEVAALAEACRGRGGGGGGGTWSAAMGQLALSPCCCVSAHLALPAGQLGGPAGRPSTIRGLARAVSEATAGGGGPSPAGDISDILGSVCTK